MKLQRALEVLIFIFILMALTYAAWHGMGKQIEINENTYYDAQSGRMVYGGNDDR